MQGWGRRVGDRIWQCKVGEEGARGRSGGGAAKFWGWAGGTSPASGGPAPVRSESRTPKPPCGAEWGRVRSEPKPPVLCEIRCGAGFFSRLSRICPGAAGVVGWTRLRPLPPAVLNCSLGFRAKLRRGGESCCVGPTRPPTHPSRPLPAFSAAPTF